MSEFSNFSPREVELINSAIMPLIIGWTPFVPLHSQNLHVGYEQFAVFQSMLSILKPAVSLEIGTFQGQMFSLIAQHSKLAISVDPDPSVKQKIQPFHPDAEFITATSDDALPGLIQRIQAGTDPLEFVFLDGNHSKDFVRRDINNLLQYRPKTRTVILMHDSFNADCRSGMLAADWQSCRHCHFVDLDFSCGVVHPNPGIKGQLWGGLGFALLLPETRKEDLTIRQTHALTFAAANKPPAVPWWKQLFSRG